MDSRRDDKVGHKFKKLFSTREFPKEKHKEKSLRETKYSERPTLTGETLTNLSNEEIERKFLLMLEDMNLSKEQTISLREKSIDVKLAMLENYEKKPESAKNNPSLFAKILAMPQQYSEKQLSNSLESLRVNLLNNGVSWVKEFNNPLNDGLNGLLRFIALALTGYYPTCALICLRCIRALGNCGYGLYALVSHQTASTFISRCLSSDQTSMIDCAIELLSSIALCNAEGYQKVLDGLTLSAEFSGTPGDRFLPLIKALGCPEVAIASLQFINVLVNRSCLDESSFDVDYRIHLRLEFNKLGIAEKLSELESSTDKDIQNHISIYKTRAEQDLDELFERVDAAKCDLDDPTQVFQILNRTLSGTKAEKHFVSMLQHLLFVRDEPYRLAYFTLLEELLGQVVLQSDGFDPDPYMSPLHLDVEAIVSMLVDALKEADASTRVGELQNKLDAALQAKIEAEAKIQSLQIKLNSTGSTLNDNSVKIPPGLEEKIGSIIPKPPSIPTIPHAPSLVPNVIPPPPPLPTSGKVPPPPTLGVPAPPKVVAERLPFGMKPKKKYNPDVPMKKANWEKIKPDMLDKNSVWVNINEDELDCADLLANLSTQFSTKPMKVQAADAQSDAVSTTDSLASLLVRKPKKLRFLDDKIAKHLSILLASLKIPFDELRRRIICVDESLLCPNMLEQLIKALPDAQTITKITGLIDEYDTLAEPEQFVCKIGNIQKLLPRLTSILFKLKFEEKKNEIKPEIVDVDEALREIRTSPHFKRVLELVLLVGNYMNAGSRNAQSIGFEIQFLTKLEATKDATNTRTLLNFIVDALEQKFPDSIKGIIDDLSHVERACRVSEDVLKSNLTEMKKSVSNIETDLRTYKSQGPADAYLDVMQSFLGIAKEQVAQLQVMYDRMQEKFLDVAKYLAFDPHKYHMENLFADIKDFRAAFIRTVTENAKQRALEERRKAALEEQARRLREREMKIHISPAEGTHAPKEDEGNVIDNLMEALKSGAAFAHSADRSAAKRNRMSRMNPAAASLASIATPAIRQRQLMRARTRNFNDFTLSPLDVA